MNFNKLYESIFKAASDEEVKSRYDQGRLERLKLWMDENNIKYNVDEKGNITNITDGGRALLWASGHANTIMGKFLIDKGVDINTRSNNNYTPLMYACMDNYQKFAEMLVDNGADVNLKDNYGETALMHICKINTGATDLINKLIKNSENIDDKNKHGDTALLLACASENTTAMKLLLENGANPNIRNDDGYNALSYINKYDVILRNIYTNILRKYGVKE